MEGIEEFCPTAHFMLILFRVVNYVIIATFALEYFSKLYVADSRKAYATNPWHILDFMIVALSLAIFFPWIPFAELGRTSPVLRLLRVTRIFAVAGRTAVSYTHLRAHETRH